MADWVADIDLDLMAFGKQAHVERAEVAGIPYPEKTHCFSARSLGCLACPRVEAELLAITFKRTRAVPEPHQRALADGAGTPRIFGNEWAQHLAIPFFRMLHVEHRMERKVMPFLWRDAEAAQSLVDISGARRCGHLDHTKRSDRVIGVATVMRECDHRVAERKGLRNDRIRRGSKIEVAGKPF